MVDPGFPRKRGGRHEPNPKRGDATYSFVFVMVEGVATNGRIFGKNSSEIPTRLSQTNAVLMAGLAKFVVPE